MAKRSIASVTNKTIVLFIGLLLFVVVMCSVISNGGSRTKSTINHSPPVSSTPSTNPGSTTGSCMESDIAKLKRFYDGKMETYLSIAKAAQSSGITQSLVDRANNLAYSVIDYKVPSCASTAHTHFETYVSMMAVSLKKQLDGESDAAIYALSRSNEAFNRFTSALEKLP